MRLDRLAALAAIAASLAGSYLLGAYSFSHDLWPIHALRGAVHVAAGANAARDHFDIHGRLIARSDKQAVACPAQTPGTAVILFIGQSIQSNSAGQRAVSAHGDKVVSWFDGACTIASSPLLGTTGTAGEVMTPIGNRLVAMGAFSQVVLAASSIGGTRVQQWAPGGDLAAMFVQVLNGLAAQYHVTHVIWDQGEDDFSGKTTQADYMRDFTSVVQTIRAHGIDAPIFVTVASRCDDEYRWTPDNDIVRAQNALVNADRKIFAGVNTDALLGPMDRFDDCHLSGAGVEALSRASADMIAHAPH